MEISDELKMSFINPLQKAIINIRHTSNWMSYRQNSYMSQFDISMAQFNILRILRGAKDFLSVNTVKERMIEKSPNTTRLMDKLIEKELIERARCEDDRRVVFVKITSNGLDVLAKIDLDFEQLFLFSHKITSEEAEQLSNILDKLRS
jgi:DNA-binding MarR family transcriptional regulator